MAWNKPSNDNFNSDPWSKPDNKSKNSLNHNKKKKKKFFNLQCFFSFFSKSIQYYGKNFSSSKNIKRPIIIILSISLLFSFFSGFYIVKETERGVILNLGKFSHVVNPGIHWRPIFFNNIKYVNVEMIREISLSDLLFSEEGKLLNIEINVQYKIINPKDYLFSASDPDDNLRQIINGTIHSIIGHYSTDIIFKKDNSFIKNKIKKEIEKKINVYKLGMMILQINFKKIHLPKIVLSVFDNIILANKNKKEYIDTAIKYANEVIFLANKRSKYMLAQAKAYKIYMVEEAKGNIIRFSKILYEYNVKKQIILEKLNIKEMKDILSFKKNILLNKNHNILLLFLLNEILLNNYK